MTRVFRLAAIAIAVAALVDPALAYRQRLPLRAAFVLAPSDSAIAVRDRLLASLGRDVTLGEDNPAAVVLVGAVEPPPIRAGVPMSVVTLGSDGPNVRVTAMAQPEIVLPGQDVPIAAALEANNVRGQSTTIDLEQDGVRVARVDHRWSRDAERFVARFTCVPAASGIQRIRVIAQPLATETVLDDNGADAALIAATRTLRVAVYEPRPSWASGFVRRALEADPIFAVASLARASRGIDVRAGAPLSRITAAALAPFDAVLVGAPEELEVHEIDALDAFARVRGGAVALAPDRFPSGAYLSLLPARRFEQALTEKPQVLTGDRPIGILASELAMVHDLAAGGVPLASVARPGRGASGTLTAARAVIASWPLGAGRVLFSGALDAWRYRERDANAFARFWTGTVANLAAAASRPLTVSLGRALVAPGEPVVVRAKLGAAKRAAVRASLVGADASEQFVRLWPLAEAGAFQGTAVVPAGRYVVRVITDAGDVAETPLIAAEGVRHPPALDDEGLALMAAGTGGVVTRADDLAPLQRHLRDVARPASAETRHPMRSPWWSVALAAALGCEWTLRRRRGDR